MTEGAARMSIPVLSSTLLQAEHIITVFLRLLHTPAVPRLQSGTVQPPTANTLWVLHLQSGISRLFGAFLFLSLQAVWLTPLPLAC